MKIYYVANARMPHEKAHGIQIAKMCEAFIEAGTDLTLIVPARRAPPVSLREFYGLRADVPMKRLPVLDTYLWAGKFGHALASGTFILSYLCFFFGKKLQGERFVLYTLDIDSSTHGFLALIGATLVSEMHIARPRTLGMRLLMRQARMILPINSVIETELRARFPRSRATYLVSPNGVDPRVFHPRPKDEARRSLGLVEGVRIVLYAGRYIDWKGLEILPEAANGFPPETYLYMVGGTKEEFERLVGTAHERMVFVGSKRYEEMPEWLASADLLLVLGTKRDPQSYRYTSPMKLFEYMSIERPILAADTPAIRQIVSEETAYFYEPDNARNLATMVTTMFEDVRSSHLRAEAASREATTYSWTARAERILASL